MVNAIATAVNIVTIGHSLSDSNAMRECIELTKKVDLSRFNWAFRLYRPRRLGFLQDFHLPKPVYCLVPIRSQVGHHINGAEWEFVEGS